MRRSWVIITLLLVAVCAPQLRAASVTPEELAEASRWTAAKFEGKAEAPSVRGYLMSYVKYGQVQRNQTDGKPLKIVDKQYRRGLFCPSVGQIVVHLPGPAKMFEAIVGFDSNRVNGFVSAAGRGDAIASVAAGGKELFKSPAMREGMAGIPVKVDLAGASELTLGLRDAGGGILFGADFNQADWAEARVTMADGKTVWLGDLPVGPLRAAYTSEPPFSFRYGDRASKALLKTWELKRSSRQLDVNRTERTLTYTDPGTGLQVRCVAVIYNDFPTVEWTLYFKNTGSQPTPILENIQALDMRLERDGDGEFVLHHNKGVPATMTDYRPYETRMEPKAEKRITANDSLPLNTDMPNFNIEWSGQGVIAVIGWPGQWASQFTRDDGTGLRVQAGQELTHLKLLPGEEIRTPLVVLQFWKGEWIHSQNVWRRWMIAHNLPRTQGKLTPPLFSVSSAGIVIEMQGATEQNTNDFLDSFVNNGFKVDTLWMDAGWHVFEGGWWNTGTWEPDPKRFPNGIRAVSDHAHAKGVKTILWFAPEMVAPGTWLYVNHPEWLLGPKGQTRCLNLGNPEARKWMTDHVDKLITEQGIDIYRQDAGTGLHFWRDNDAEDRQGITEIRHVEGYLAYWDELRRRHPNLMLDICCGGGRRNELESLRRAVPLHRSDYSFEPVGMQLQKYGISLWIPYYGMGLTEIDKYTARSHYAPALAVCWDLHRKDLDAASLRGYINQWRQVVDNYFGDYYPLTSYSPEPDVWMAWQFDRPEAGEGIVEAYRRAQSVGESVRLKLQGLDPGARYTLTNVDAPGTTEMTGRELMEQGLVVTLKNQPDSALIVYKRAGTKR